MKKTFLGITMAAIIAMSGFTGAINVSACGPNDLNCQTAEIDLTAIASSFESQFTNTNNDWAYAGASGYTLSNVKAESEGFTQAIVSGDVFARNNSTAQTWVNDYGTMSSAGGYAYTTGQGYAYGNAYGDSGDTYYGVDYRKGNRAVGYFEQRQTGAIKYFGGPGLPLHQSAWDYLGKNVFSCGDQSVTTLVTVAGNVFQEHYAAETGYPEDQYAVGFNSSGADFSITRESSMVDIHSAYAQAGFYDYWYDYYYWYGYGPYAYTEGYSNVSIDAIGNERSSNATTWNASYTNQGYNYFDYGTVTENVSNVTGNGLVAVHSAKGGTHGYGVASFTYDGNNYGSGNAEVNANITNYGNNSTAHVSGYASSYVSNNVGEGGGGF